MFRCKHVFFQFFHCLANIYTSLTATEYSPLSLSTLICMHAHRQTGTHTRTHTHTHTHTHARTETHRVNVKNKKQSSVEWCSSSAWLCFSSGDVEDACDSTESHTSLLRPSSVQPDLWLLAKSSVSHQSQGQHRAHVPSFYSDGLSPSWQIEKWRSSNPNKRQMKASSWPQDSKTTRFNQFNQMTRVLH